MLGLIGEGTGIAAKVLKSMGTSSRPARRRSPLPQRFASARDRKSFAVPYPLSRRVNRERALFPSRRARATTRTRADPTPSAHHHL